MATDAPDHLPSFKRFMTTHLGRIFTKRRVMIGGLLVAAFLIITPVATYAYFARDIGDRERIMNRNQTGVVLKDKHGEVFYRQGSVSLSDDLKLDQISDHMEKAVIASEDAGFYEHEGYSVRGIAAAVYANVMNKDATRYGGSTITQQLIKNKLFSQDKSYIRKYQEVSMAIALEQKYDKTTILEMYLNSVYFGEGAFGISDAAKTYFNKTAADLTLAESAMLAGLLPAPNLYSPISGDAGLGKKQQDRVLSRMLETETITKEEREAAAVQELAYNKAASDEMQHARHFGLMVMQQLAKDYGEERVARDGFAVTTTLDLKRQKQAEAIMARRIAQFEDAGGRNGSMVGINPKTGEVEVLVGSVDWNNQEFGKVNMTQAARQPGSAFKPIYYAEALATNKITAATILHDKKTTFGDWTPENYDFKFRGDISARKALALSLNIPAAEVMQKVGADEASAAARRMGISTVTEPEKYGLTLALGTAETTLYEMTNAYAAFANAGKQFEPTLITTIDNKYGDQVYARTVTPHKQVISAEASFITSSMLSDTAARAPTFGSSLNVPGRPAAAKTGTTNDNRDAWTIGYTPQLAIGVWVGNNENKPMSGLAGASSAGVIWRETMQSLMTGVPAENFQQPAGVVQLAVCASNGLRADSRGGSGTYMEYFIRGSEPTAPCRTEKKPETKQEEKRDKKQDRQERSELDDDAADDPTAAAQQTAPTAAPAPPEQTAGTPAPPGGRGGTGTDSGGSTSGSGTRDIKPPEPVKEEGGVKPADD